MAFLAGLTAAAAESGWREAGVRRAGSGGVAGMVAHPEGLEGGVKADAVALQQHSDQQRRHLRAAQPDDSGALGPCRAPALAALQPAELGGGDDRNETSGRRC